MTIAERLDLGPNEFAFHFETEDGIEVDALANFLKRAATVAKRQGGELRIVGLREGSLAVIIEAIRKSKIAKNAAKEFTDKPIDSTIKTTTFVAAIVWGIIHTMSPEKSGDTPLGKAGADIIEKQPVMQITIVTSQSSTVVMDQEIAKRVREVEKSIHPALAVPGAAVERLPERVVRMMEDAREGNLFGEALLVDGELHFRPDGFRYLVPVDERARHGTGQLFPGAHFRVTGHLATRNGQPDRIVIHSAVPVTN